MTFDDDYRTLAQKVRQTARAQLLEIRAARQARKPGPAAPVQGAARPVPLDEGLALRRRRKSDRMARQLQESRLQAALASGEIELWDGPVMAEPSLVPADCPVLVDTCPAEDWGAALLPSPAAPPGSIEIWGPPRVARQSKPEETLEYFGPPWDPALSAPQDDTGPIVAQDAATSQNPEQDLWEGEYFGPFLPDLAEDPEGEDLNGQAAEDAALSLSDGLRAFAGSTDQADQPATCDTDPDATEMAQTDASDDMAQPAPTVQLAAEDVVSSQHMLAENLRPAPRRQGSDLSSLPGAGPGLIWMLQKCGISSLEDLAEADAATLVPKLGLVGQIVNVPGWQRFAQRQVGLPH